LMQMDNWGVLLVPPLRTDHIPLNGSHFSLFLRLKLVSLLISCFSELSNFCHRNQSKEDVLGLISMEGAGQLASFHWNPFLNKPHPIEWPSLFLVSKIEIGFALNFAFFSIFWLFPVSINP
jgi:hypothetical protein